MDIKSFTGKVFGTGKKKANKRSFKYGSLATALTVLFVAAVVLLNVVATMLFDRFPITFDLTENSIYSVSEETVNYIKGIDSLVDITVMSTEDEYRAISDYTVQTAELLKNYQQHNPNISVSYKDFLSNPDFVANYSQTLQQGDIIIELAGSDHQRVKVISLTDILNFKESIAAYIPMNVAQYGAYAVHVQSVNNDIQARAESERFIDSSNAEQVITSALMAVTDANPITVAVLNFTGGNESDVSGLTDLLDKNGYILTELNIQTEELTDEIDLIIIPAPKIDYTTKETEKISTWLTNGGVLGKHMVYIASAEQPVTPNLDSLLYKYGLTVEPKVIYETNTSRYLTYQTYTLQTIATENHLDDVANLNLPIYVPNSRAVTTRFENIDSYNSNEPLVMSSNGAVLKDMFVNDDSWKAEDVEEKNAYTSVALASYKALNQETHISTYNYILAIGSELIVDPVLMTSAQYNNGDFILSVINEVTGKTEGITIVPKVVRSNSFEITQSNINTLTLIFAAIIPVAVFVVGMVIWIRRRHR
ncbi:MAG: GldG family protein [Oscillospiraceae bacterium]|nr:GldG family protein [Oscillospiraceae bacterium]